MLTSFSVRALLSSDDPAHRAEVGEAMRALQEVSDFLPC